MNFLLEFSKEQFTVKNLPVADVLSNGGMTLLTGMAIVFGVLTLLWFTLAVFKLFFHDLTGKKIKKAKNANEDVAPIVSPIHKNNDEIVAVIAAAIAMAESESSSGVKFRVVSFRRK